LRQATTNTFRQFISLPHSYLVIFDVVITSVSHWFKSKRLADRTLHFSDDTEHFQLGGRDTSSLYNCCYYFKYFKAPLIKGYLSHWPIMTTFQLPWRTPRYFAKIRKNITKNLVNRIIFNLWQCFGDCSWNYFCTTFILCRIEKFNVNLCGTGIKPKWLVLCVPYEE